MNFSNKKALILSLPMILAIFLLGGWFLFREQKVSEESPKPPVVGENPTQNPGNIEPPANIDTSNWKTYRNEEYGFELKYPGEWRFQAETPPVLGGEWIVFDPIISDVKKPGLNFILNIHRSSKTLREWSIERPFGKMIIPTDTTLEEKEINGYPAISVTEKGRGYIDYRYIISHRGLILLFTFRPVIVDLPSYMEYAPAYDYMVNSIKFL
jgi:hypothetical protein